MEDSAYRNVRRMSLADYCMIAKLDYPKLQHIIGVACEPVNGEFSSEDFVYLDVTEWSEEQEQEALQLKEEYQRIGMLVPRLAHENHFSFDNLGQ